MNRRVGGACENRHKIAGLRVPAECAVPRCAEAVSGEERAVVDSPRGEESRRGRRDYGRRGGGCPDGERAVGRVLDSADDAGGVAVAAGEVPEAAVVVDGEGDGDGD